LVNFGREIKDFGSVAVNVCVPLGCGTISHRNRDINTQTVHRGVLAISDVISW
jgi:hypothetical protein